MGGGVGGVRSWSENILVQCHCERSGAWLGRYGASRCRAGVAMRRA
jgi:hypothetical protein